VRVRFSFVQRRCVCLCMRVLYFLLHCSRRLSLLVVHILLHLNPNQDPTVEPPPSPRPATDFFINYCSSFILLRAEPALNHSICVSLKVWFREMDSWLPSLCLITAVTTWRRQKKTCVDIMGRKLGCSSDSCFTGAGFCSPCRERRISGQ